MVLRTKPEKKEEKERIRLALLRATLRLAAAHGFASLGLREVSREAGIAPTSFYRHFADMEELGLALVRELVSPMLTRWGERTRMAARTRRDVMLAALEAALSGVRDDPDLTRFVVTERVGAFPPIRRALRAELTALSRTLELSLRAAPDPTPRFPSEGLLEAAVVLLLEAVMSALELADEDASALRANAVEQLSRLLQLEGNGP